MSTHFFGIKDWTFSYSHTVGRNEFAGTGFRNPVDLALGANDVVYVLNRSYENRPDGIRVTMCTLKEEYIKEFGSYGEEDGQFIWPTSITLDASGNVYVSDEWLNRISIFDKDGNFLSKWGKAGAGNGELNKPAGLAIGNDTLYVTDSGNHRVQSFTLDGKYLGHFGSFGSGQGQFNLPWGIALGPDDTVYVADWRNDRIQKFTPDGRFLMKFGSSGSGEGEFKRPTDVAVDNEGLIYVADWDNDRLQIFDADGRFMTLLTGDATLSKWGETKLDANPEMRLQREVAQGLEREKFFRGPIGVTVDDQDRIFVVDSQRNRIQVYRKIPPYFLGRWDGGRL
jgi:DNA-binding beta-propeller fold protein YncE